MVDLLWKNLDEVAPASKSETPETGEKLVKWKQGKGIPRVSNRTVPLGEVGTCQTFQAQSVASGAPVCGVLEQGPKHGESKAISASYLVEQVRKSSGME